MMIEIDENIKGKRYKRLIDWLQKHCDYFAFVVNGQLMNLEERYAFIETIDEHLMERKVQTEWETTILSGGDIVHVYYFQLNNVTKDFLKESATSLFEWLHPDLPEDLMFYQNGKCVLAVCSHEKYFIVDEDFWNNFQRNR